MKTPQQLADLLHRVAFAAIASILVVAACAGCKPVYKTRTARFAQDVTKVSKAPELQQWAMTILQATNQTGMTEIPKEKVPAAVRGLISDGSPLQDAYRDDRSPENRIIWLIWGGGFGHWGILIGPSSFKVSPGDDNYYIQWEPGVYFWHQKH